MAITRTQQARQMLRDGTNYNPSKIVSVPKEFKAREDSPNTKLAYITKDEEKLLKKLKPGTPHKGPEGIPNYDSFDISGGYTSGRDIDDSTGQARDPGQRFSGGNEQQERETRERNLRNLETSRKAQEDYFKSEKFKKERKANRKTIRDNLKRDTKNRRDRINKILSGGFGKNNPYGLSPTELKDLEVLGYGVEDLYGEEGPNKFFEDILTTALEKDDRLSGVNLETFQNRTLDDTGAASLPGPLLSILKSSGLLDKGMKGNRKFFSADDYKTIFGNPKKSVLEAGKYTFNGNPITQTQFEMLSPAEMEEVYGDYMSRRSAGEIDAYGNPINRDLDADPTDPCKGPNPPAYCFIGQRAETPPEDPVFTPSFRFMNRGGMVEDAPMGGIMDLDTTRQMLFIGGIAKGISKGLKSITRGIKKVAKSPIGKAALLGAVGFGIPGTKFGGLFGGKFANMTLPKLITDNMSGLKVAAMSGLGGALLASLEDKDDDDFNIEEYYKMAGLNMPENQYRFLAEGGSTEKEPVAKKTMPLLDLEGQEMDFRQDGGFVPIGRMEKADDVPARLSKNEFVFTAEAVRNAGGGDVDKGAEVMYNTMKNLEAGGEVSEETQGLEGARNMFQTSQRLGEVV